MRWVLNCDQLDDGYIGGLDCWVPLYTRRDNLISRWSVQCLSVPHKLVAMYCCLQIYRLIIIIGHLSLMRFWCLLVFKKTPNYAVMPQNPMVLNVLVVHLRNECQSSFVESEQCLRYFWRQTTKCQNLMRLRHLHIFIAVLIAITISLSLNISVYSPLYIILGAWYCTARWFFVFSTPSCRPSSIGVKLLWPNPCAYN